MLETTIINKQSPIFFISNSTTLLRLYTYDSKLSCLFATVYSGSQMPAVTSPSHERGNPPYRVRHSRVERQRHPHMNREDGQIKDQLIWCTFRHGMDLFNVDLVELKNLETSTLRLKKWKLKFLKLSLQLEKIFIISRKVFKKQHPYAF